MSQEIKDRIDAEVNPYTSVKPKVIGDIIKDVVDEVDVELSTKLDKNDYNQHFRGSFPSLTALENNVFTPPLEAGDKAQVNQVGQDVVNYTWDNDDNKWVEGSSGSGANNTDELPEGSENLYFTVERAENVINEEKKNYEKDMYVFSKMEVYFPMRLAGQISTLITDGLANVKVKINESGTYVNFTSPVVYSSGDRVYFQFTYTNSTNSEGSITILGRDN